MNVSKTASITVRDVKAMLGSSEEYALVDVREEGDFSKAHQLLSINMPLSRLELLCGNLIPCKKTTVVIVDDDPEREGHLAERAAVRLLQLGYSDVRIMEGGIQAWASAGYKIFAGVFVPSKAFGELVEQIMDTPRLEPKEVQAMLESNRRMVVLDTRPNNEFRRMNIPTGINVPGGELVYRIYDIAPDSECFILVNCAGRTRSIIGCQTLRNAGVPNPMAALKGGTMGWKLAGLALEHGTMDRYETAPPSEEAIAVARKCAAQVAQRYRVKFVDIQNLETWRAEADSRTLYVFDVRQPVEFEAGHMPGSINVQGVTVVQSTDTCVGVRNGRVVLVDDTEVRAVITASWLEQMGYPEVYVLRGGIKGQLQRGTVEPVLQGNPEGISMIPPEVYSAMKEGVPGNPLVLDVGNSRASHEAHLPGALWGTRSCLAHARDLHAAPGNVILVCDTGPVSLLASEDASKLWPGARVAWMRGGTRAWVAAGLPVETGLEHTFSPINDVYNRPYEGERTSEEMRKAMIEYLSWEVGLVDDITAEGDLRFNIR